MTRSLMSAVLCLLAVAVSFPAQGSADDVLKKAREYYAAGAYDSTVSVIRRFLVDGGKDPATEHLVPLLAEALSRTKDIEYTERLYAIYRKKFPQAAYLPRMHYLAGIAAARARRFETAVERFSLAVAGGVNATLDSLIQNNILLLSEEAFTPRDVADLAERTDLHPRVREALSYGLIRAWYRARQLGRAERAARDFQERFPRSSYAPFAARIASSAGSEKGGHVLVGLLAPLTGYDADIGKAILHGAQLAVAEHNASSANQVKLIVRDTRGRAVATAHQTRTLIEEVDAPVFIGPVLSQNAAVTAAMLYERDQVMLSPTATEEGIAELGPNLFQMNVTTGVLGRAIAEYAMTNLSIADFALLTPMSEYGRVLSASFKDEVKSRGGVVVAEEFFDEGTSDLRPQFTRLRQVLFERRKKLDTLAMGDSTTPVPYRTAHDDSLLLADSTLSVGGLFIPAESEDVVMAAPQVFFYKIRTQLLGATGWYNPKTILDGKRYVNNAILVASAETDRRDSLWIAFAKRYQSRFGVEADRVAALGYDAAKLVCDVVHQLGGSVTTERVSQALAATRGYRGAAGMISFDPKRGVNSEAVILKISGKEFIRVH